jgi:hypothetical protein
LGRSKVLGSVDPELGHRPFSMISFQFLRIFCLGGVVAVWWWALRRAADSTIGRNPEDLLGYFAWAIVLSIGAFSLWALSSWILSIAPLIALREGTGVLPALARSFRLGPLAGKLVEVNLVLGIVKLALIVLAMVLSAIPLPFAPNLTGTPLYLWWAGVTVLYFAASDFFQVARLRLFIQLWDLYGSGQALEAKHA